MVNNILLFYLRCNCLILGYGGILIVVFVCSVQIYTAHLLGKCWMMAEIVEPSIKYKIRYPYSALAEITYGKRFCRIVTIFVDMTIFGGGIPNLIVGKLLLL